MLRIAIPEEYWGAAGWSLLLRFRGLRSGSFQIANAKIFNVYRKRAGPETGPVLDILLHQKKFIRNDLEDMYSFVIMADRLVHGDMRKSFVKI